MIVGAHTSRTGKGSNGSFTSFNKRKHPSQYLQNHDGRDSELDLELRLGPNDSSKGSHITNDKHDTVPQAGQKRKRYDATRLTLSTNMDLTQKAKQDATHPLTKMERYELHLEKKRLYMREKKRKLEEMGSEMIKLDLERKRMNQRRYVARLKSDPKSRDRYLQKKAEAHKQYRKQNKASKKQIKELEDEYDSQ